MRPRPTCCRSPVPSRDGYFGGQRAGLSCRGADERETSTVDGLSRHRFGRTTAVLATAVLVRRDVARRVVGNAAPGGASTDPQRGDRAAGPARRPSPPGASDVAGARRWPAPRRARPRHVARPAAALAGLRRRHRLGPRRLDHPGGRRPARRHRSGRDRTLNADDRVRFVQPNYRLHAFNTPNDPLLARAVRLGDAVVGGISAPTAWNTTFGSSSVVIGVLDSGVELDHPDLAANLWTNRTGINGCGYGTHGYNAIAADCNPNDDDGHGTHVAGIAAARGNNGDRRYRCRSPGLAHGAEDARQPRRRRHVQCDPPRSTGPSTPRTRASNLRVLNASWGGTSTRGQHQQRRARAGDRRRRCQRHPVRDRGRQQRRQRR